MDNIGSDFILDFSQQQKDKIKNAKAFIYLLTYHISHFTGRVQLRFQLRKRQLKKK
jgi:hypothetical protein